MTRVLRMIPRPVREVAPVQDLPAVVDGPSEWRRWRVWIIAGPVLFAICCGLLVVAIEVTR